MMSDRDKTILGIFLIVVIICASVFVYNKTSDGNVTYEKELKDLKEKSEDLDYKNNKKAYFLEETKKNTEIYNQAYADYNTWLSQEHVLMFLSAIEKNTNVRLDQMSLNVATEAYKFGQVRSTNPSRRGSIVYNTDNLGITTTSNVSYSCKYEELKDVLTYIKENGRKVVIDNMSYTYDRANDKVSGTMSLSFYAIAGSDRPVQDININDVFVGTENIFASNTFMPDATISNVKDMVASNYDLYMILNKYGSDKDAIIIGQRGDINNEAMISTNAEGVQNVTIKITGTAGDYKISYEVGSRQYPVQNFDEGAPFVCGDSIELFIMSSERGGINDATGVKLKVINQTDLIVNVAVVNDDPNSTRVTNDGSEGTVNFH